VTVQARAEPTSRTQRGKIGWTFDAQKRAQTFARSMHAAANGADRTIAGLRRFPVREARVTNCDQSLAHFFRQLQQRASQIRMFCVCNLSWVARQRCRMSSVYVFDLFPPLAAFVLELIAEDRHEPRQYSPLMPNNWILS
jgi:hypothetical protein